MSKKRQQFVLTLGGCKYVTYDGVDKSSVDFIKSKNDGKNLMKFMQAKMDMTCSSVFKDVSTVGVNDLPEITVTFYKEENNVFIVDGTATVDGQEVTVHIDADGTKITYPNEPEPVEEEVEVEDEPVEEAKVDEPAPEPVIEEEQEDEEEPVEPVDNFVNIPTPDVNSASDGKVVSFGPRSKASIMSPMKSQFGHSSKKQHGFVVNGRMPMPNISENYRCRSLREVSVTGRRIGYQNWEELTLEPIKPTPAPAPKPEPEVSEEERLMEKWAGQKPVDITDRWKEAELVPVIEESIKEETVTITEDDGMDYKAAKEAIRAKLDPEVNKIIGDIPHAMLGNITPFTLTGVDKERLEKEKDIYCIDNHWMNAGNWYCVDVVHDAARYFFNSKMHVSLQIPVSVLKQWKQVVT